MSFKLCFLTGDHWPSSVYREIVGIKQNGPVKHFKDTPILSCKCFLFMLVTVQFHSHLLTPSCRPGPEVAMEKLGVGWEGMTKMHNSKRLLVGGIRLASSVSEEIIGSVLFVLLNSFISGYLLFE